MKVIPWGQGRYLREDEVVGNIGDHDDVVHHQHRDDLHDDDYDDDHIDDDYNDDHNDDDDNVGCGDTQ